MIMHGGLHVIHTVRRSSKRSICVANKNCCVCLISKEIVAYFTFQKNEDKHFKASNQVSTEKMKGESDRK